MRNIYTRSKFKKLYEDSSSVKDVANVSNQPDEIIKAWNLSLVGATTNFFVGGILKGLKAIYKMGRQAWAIKNLSSKLNKEYLKGLIFYLDSKNIDSTGKLSVQGEEKNTSTSTTTTTQVQDVSSYGLSEIKEVLANINTLEEFNASPEVEEWREMILQKREEQRVYWSEGALKKYEEDIQNATNKAEKEKAQNRLNKFLKGDPSDPNEIGKEEFDKDINQVIEINKLIDEKEKELKSGSPANVTPIETILDKFKKVIPDFNPTVEIENYKLDYQDYKNLKGELKRDSIAIGDTFAYYTNAKNREVVKVINKDAEPGIVTVVSNKNHSGHSAEVPRLLPSNFPGFKVLSEMEKFLQKYGNSYENLDDENKKLTLNIYRKYLIFKEIKKDMSETHPLPSKVSESLLLELQVKPKSSKFVKGTVGVEGGDLQGNHPLKDILSDKDVERLKNPKIADLSVSDLKYGEIIKKFKEIETPDYSPKTEVAKNVNKYNLEVVRLLADKEFTDDKSKKVWATNVNRINAYWNELINISMVNVLDTKALSTDPTIKSKVNNDTSTIGTQNDLSILEAQGILGDPLVSKDIGENLIILSLILTDGTKCILAGKGYRWGLDNLKRLIRITTFIEIEEVDGKRTIKSKPSEIARLFQQQNSLIKIGDKDVSGNSPNVDTWFLMEHSQNIPKDLTRPYPAKFIIVNEITYKGIGSSNVREVCFFDFSQKKNFNINNVKTPPKIDTKLVCINLLKDTSTKMLDELQLNSLQSSQKIKNDAPDIQKALEPKKQS